MRTVLGFCLSVGLVRADESKEPFWYRLLLRSAKVALHGQTSRIVKSRIREEARDVWSDRSPEYGLSIRDDLGGRSRLILFIHGCNSRPEGLQRLIELVRNDGYVTAVFRYPNDQPLDESADSLSTALRELGRRHPELRLTVITHSMGGLVARRMLEDPELAVDSVTRLIMLAPPNHGSKLTRGAGGSDLVEYLISAARRRESGLLSGAILDGLSEAQTDLAPDSEFLRELNRRTRNPHVEYTIVAGTGAPLPPTALLTAQAWIERGTEQSPYLRIAAEELDMRVNDLDELVRGKGDGAVSVESARLQGVDDVIVAELSHCEIMLPVPTREVRRVRRLILERLNEV